MPSYTKAFFFNSITFCADSDTPLCQSSGNGAKTRRIEDFQPDKEEIYRIEEEISLFFRRRPFSGRIGHFRRFLLRIFSRIDLAGWLTQGCSDSGRYFSPDLKTKTLEFSLWSSFSWHLRGAKIQNFPAPLRSADDINVSFELWCGQVGMRYVRRDLYKAKGAQKRATARFCAPI